MKIALILLAGGVGSRMLSSTPKQFLLLNSKPLILHSFDQFIKMDFIDEIVVVVEKEKESLFSSKEKKLSFADPGKRRQDSVMSGLLKVSKDVELIVVHDGARPFVTKEMTLKLIEEATKSQAATLAVPLKFTVKKAYSDRTIVETLNRDHLWEIQTPQAISKNLLLKGFEKAVREDLTVTDDVSLVELLGRPVKLVEGSYKNIKVTTPDDLLIAETYAKL